MVLLRNVLSFAFLVAVGLPSSAQVTFRQGSFDETIPAFGGYTPNSGGRLTFSNRGGPIRFRQGSFDAALPPFGGYTPNSGGRLSFSTRRPATFRQGGANIALPPFGLLDPNSAARLQIGNPLAAQNDDGGQDPNVAENANQEGADLDGEQDNGNALRGQLPQNLPFARRLGRDGGGANSGAANLAPAARAIQPNAGDRIPAEKPSQRTRESRRQKAIDRLVKAAQSAEAAGRTAQAKMYYRMAIKRSPEDSRSDLVQRLQALK